MTYDLKNDPILKFLKHQDEHQFQPGDILIRMLKSGDEWKAEVASSTTNAPKKYLYAFENELGIGYIKQYKTDGKLNDVAKCLTSFDLSYGKFVLDPEYADHIIINGDEEFKPTSSFKEKKKFRDRAIANNKKIVLPKDRASMEVWMNQLKVGDTFYYGYNIPDMVDQKYEVIDIEDITVEGLDYYQMDSAKRKLGLSSLDKVRRIKLKLLKHRWHNVGNISKMWLNDLINRSITQKEPFPLAEYNK